MKDAMIDRGHVEAATQLAEKVCSLPAVATQSWCGLAAECLLRLRRGCVVIVSIGEVDAFGAICAAEATGVAFGVEVRQSRIEAIREQAGMRLPSEWRLGDPGLWDDRAATRAVEEIQRPSWEEHNAGRFWRSLGASEVLLGAVSLHPDTPGRVVSAEIGLVSESAGGFDSGDAAVLAGALQPLAHRAAMAFGSDASRPLHRLTRREEEVLDRLSLGMSVKQIAAELRRSPHTVHDHVKSLHTKLNASSRGELIARALGHLTTQSSASMVESPGLSGEAVGFL